MCQESNMFLNCRNRYNRLVIKDTFYGRNNNHTCSSRIFDSEKMCNEPTPDSIRKKVDLMCSGEYKCKVPVSPAFLESKGNLICPSVKKYLKVTYACHQNPKLHMVCKNCTSKCWPLCSKDCCHPPPPPTQPPTAAVIKEAPKKSTCQDGCPAHCAPNCQLSCCASKTLGVSPKTTSHESPQNSCKGDCKNICAPLCLSSCCNRHKKSDAVNAALKARKLKYQLARKNLARIQTCPVSSCPMNCRPLCQQACCRPRVSNTRHPDYVEPLSARLQRLSPGGFVRPGTQCMNGCDATCAPLCNPQCCAYMGELRALGGSSVRQQFTPIQSIVLPNAPAAVQAPPPAPVQPLVSARLPAQMAPVPMVAPYQGYPGYASPQAFFNTQTSPYTGLNQAPPTGLVTSQTLDVEEPNHSYQTVNPVTRGCPPQCATSCDASCRLDCCANPFVFTTNSVGDDTQRRTYEKLLEKYRSEQLSRYYQNRGFTG